MESGLFESRIRIVEGGGVTSAAGFKAAGVHAGFCEQPERADVALIAAEAPVACAARFTEHRFCAAPVAVSRDHLGGSTSGCGFVQAAMVNAGNANAMTGEPGRAVAREACDIVSQVMGCEPEQVLLAATGAFGVPLGIDAFEVAAPLAYDRLSTKGGSDAACAIMGRETRVKEYAVSYESEVLEYVDCTFTVGGMCTGASVPDFSTQPTIAVLTTDAPLVSEALQAALERCVPPTFGRLALSAGPSMSDMVMLMASGAAGEDVAPIAVDTPAFDEFVEALTAACEGLARLMVLDGKMGHRLVMERVMGAESVPDARRVARALATSPFVRRALMHAEERWNCVADELGRCDVAFDQLGVCVDIAGVRVVADGASAPFDRDELARVLAEPEVTVTVDLAAGDATATVWTCLDAEA